VTVKTEGGHSFGNFGNRNAIHILSTMITSLYSVKVPQEENSKTTYNVGIISGGTSVNTIAQEAQMMYEYRSDNKNCLAKMQNMFEKTIEAFRAMGVEVEVEKIGEFELEFSFGDRQILSQEGADGKFVIRLSAI
jgi:metal-dependent amidase/aminoacylase/carboxypeptidase family protein